MEEKICNQLDCEFAGQAQPIENYQKLKPMVSSKNPEGIASRCKACTKKAAKKNYQKNKANAIPEIKESKKTSRKENILPKNTRVQLDFSDYPELVDKISTKARQEFRDIEHQILYELHSIMGMQ